MLSAFTHYVGMALFLSFLKRGTWCLLLTTVRAVTLKVFSKVNSHEIAGKPVGVPVEAKLSGMPVKVYVTHCAMSSLGQLSQIDASC